MRKPVFRVLFLLLAVAIIAGCARRPAPPAVLPAAPQPGGYTDAVELKLKFREMADQMLATVPNDALKGYVAMPTAFVNANNTSQTSPLGKLIAESMYYEFNQRGFPTWEYGLSGSLPTLDGKNAKMSTAQRLSTGKRQKWAALLVGTYQVAKDATFVNARLVRASDGLVLRTAEVVLPNTPIILSLAGGSGMAAPAAFGAAAGGAYVAPQSAPVRSPTYPSLGGAVIQSGTGGIPIIQGR